MSDMDRLAASMYGSNRLEETASLVSLDTQTYIGIARADSEEGLVEVVLSDDVTQPDGGIWDGSEWQGDDDIGTSVTLPTTQSVREGERVLVSAFGGNTIATPVVTGVIGGGDSLRQDVEAVNQYFWTDEDGVHVTQIPQDEFVQSPSGPNQLSNSDGILLRDGETYLSAFTPDGMAVYDGQGNYDSNVVAQFTSDGARVGYDYSSNVTMTPNGTRFYNYLGNVVGSILSNGAEESYSAIAHPDGSAPCATHSAPVTYTYSVPVIPTDEAIFYLSFKLEYSYDGVEWSSDEDVSTVAYQSWPTTETTVTGGGSSPTRLYIPSYEEPPLGTSAEVAPYGFDSWTVILEVNEQQSGLMARLGQDESVLRVVGAQYAPTYVFGNGTASGDYAFSEGWGTRASGDYSHAEGYSSYASGNNSHAEGYGTFATGGRAHAEGNMTRASGVRSHAEGDDTEASGRTSHAQNEGTIAASSSQTALGRYNISDDGDSYALIIGNGTSDSNRSNALTVDWQGNVVCGTVNGIDIASAIAGATQFQGALDSQSTLTNASYQAGWYWVVTTAGTYAGNVCEQGDMVYAVADRGSAYSASDFAVVQANVDMSLYVLKSELLFATDEEVAALFAA